LSIAGEDENTKMSEGARKLRHFVRESFDELYFRLGQLEDSIQAGLVLVDDVKTPVDYYADLMAEDARTHYFYMAEFGYQKALHYLDQFPSWKKAVGNLPKHLPAS
jgi:hypothetical protein